MTTALGFRSLATTAAALVCMGLALTACAPGDDEAAPTPSAPSSSTSAEPSQEAGAIGDADVVLAEATTDLADKGVITSVIRSIAVDDEVMHLRYALSRDGGEPADASFTALGIGNAPTVTDAAALKAYRPFCASANGDWNGDALARQQCELHVMGTVPNTVDTPLAADSTLEISVLLPSPQERPETVDVLLGDGLPGFADVPVTYVDDAR